MKRVSAMLKTTAVRLSLLYLVLFFISATALLFYVTSVSEGLLRDQTERSIEREVRSVSNAYRAGGINAVVRHVERRSRQPGSNLFVIASPIGEIFAGNVAEIAPGVFDDTGPVDIAFAYSRYGDQGAGLSHQALGHIIDLPNGLKLLIGRDLDEPDRFGKLIEQALMTALAIMGIGALCIWFFVGRTALKRIDRMTLASEKIMAGDLAQRLPVTGSGDEFDRLSTSLNAMLGRIERLNEGLRQVSDNIAHDLKTPLTRLRNRAEATLSSDCDVDAYRDAMEDMIGESDQLIRIFSALLMISRVEAGSAVAQMQNIDLSAVARDAAELYEPLAEEANVRIDADITPNLTINGNRELIGQALSNLIDNAVKYASGQDNAWIKIRLEQDGAFHHLSILDNGKGIPQSKRSEVVKRFVRLDESRNKPGTGLGLALVEAVMRLHGGQLLLEDTIPSSKELPGLTVKMIFPKIT